MKKIEAGEFKKHCLNLLDHLDADGLIITREGVPVARVVPIHGSSAVHSDDRGSSFNDIRDAELIGSLRGKLKIKGNILSTGCEWEADTRS